MRMKLKSSQAEMILALVILARSTSFVMTKIGLRDMGAFTLLSYRFLVAFVVLLPFSFKRIRRIKKTTLMRGMIIGAGFFSVLILELTALGYTGSGMVAVLENTAIVFVPIFEAIYAKRYPERLALLSGIIAFTGVVLLSFNKTTFQFGLGEILAIVAAMLYAIAIMITSRLSKEDNPISLGIVQVGAMGLYSIIGAFFFEVPRLPNGILEWQIILMLAIICTGFGFTLQPLAQSGTTAERAGLFCGLSPCAAAVLGWLILGERFALPGIIGIVMILTAMFLKDIMTAINQIWRPVKEEN